MMVRLNGPAPTGTFNASAHPQTLTPRSQPFEMPIVCSGQH